MLRFSEKPCVLSRTISNAFLPAVRSGREYLGVYYPILFVKARVKVRPEVPGIANREHRLFVLPTRKVTLAKEIYGLTVDHDFERDLRSIPENGLLFFDVEYLRKTDFVGTAFSKVKKTLASMYGGSSTVYYVTRINKYSRLGEDFSEFKKRIESDIREYLRTKREQLESTYAIGLREVKLAIENVKAELNRLKELRRALKRNREKESKKGLFRKRHSTEATEVSLEKIAVEEQELLMRLRLLRKEYYTLERERDREMREFYRHYPRIKTLTLRITERNIKIVESQCYVLWLPLGLDSDTLVPRVNLYNGSKITDLSLAWRLFSREV